MTENYYYYLEFPTLHRGNLYLLIRPFKHGVTDEK